MYFVIYNPASQSGNGLRIWHKVRAVLDEEKVEYRVYKTTPTRNGMMIARKLLATRSSGAIRLMVLGGDGTVNEVVQAFEPEDFHRVRFYYIPTGSSNDLARSLGFDGDTEKHVRHIISTAEHKDMDVGILKYNKAETLGYTKRYFLVSCGMGFDASVCAEAMNSKYKNFLNRLGLGKLSYLTITLKQLIEAPNAKCIITNDDGSEVSVDKCLFVACMNHMYQGGGLPFCPDAVDDDGLLDICYAGGISKPRVLYSLTALMKGKHIGMKGICGMKTGSLHILSDTPLYVHTDGEVKTKATDITVSIISEKLWFAV